MRMKIRSVIRHAVRCRRAPEAAREKKAKAQRHQSIGRGGGRNEMPLRRAEIVAVPKRNATLAAKRNTILLRHGRS